MKNLFILNPTCLKAIIIHSSLRNLIYIISGWLPVASGRMLQIEDAALAV